MTRCGVAFKHMLPNRSDLPMALPDITPMLLARLEKSELLLRLEELDPAFSFKHALIQATAYSSLLKNERKRLHRLIGEILERAYPEALQENAALLVAHFIEAGDDAKILEYGTCAGDAEARVFAKIEAIAHYRAALDAALRLDAEPRALIDLVTKIGRMYELREEVNDALKIYSTLIDIAHRQGTPELELAALMLEATLRATPTALFNPVAGQALLDRALALARELNDGAAEARILWNLLLLNGFTGRHRAAVEYGEQSLALARKLELKTQIAYTLNDIGNYGYFADGQPQKARAAQEEARALWRELEILPMLADNLNNSGILEYVWGDYARARRFSDEALEVSERIDSLWGQMLARTFRGVCMAEAGAYGAALAELEAAYDIAKRSGAVILVIAATNLALLYAELGAIEAGHDVIQIANQEIGIPLYRAPAKATLAYLTWLRGDAAHAESILKDGQPGHRDELEFSYLPSIIARGEIGLAAGSAEEVVEFMAALAESLLRFGISSFVADADLYRGRALTMLGRHDEARAAFERAYAFATRLGSRRVLWRICGQWELLESAMGNRGRAVELEREAAALIESIVASLPVKYRASFLQQNGLSPVRSVSAGG